jgi:hypothetical protein
VSEQGCPVTEAAALREAYRGVHGGPLELAAGEHLRLHILLDRSIDKLQGTPPSNARGLRSSPLKRGEWSSVEIGGDASC